MRRRDDSARNIEIRMVEWSETEIDLTIEELHAYNCLIFSNENACKYLWVLTADSASINVCQAHYAAWLIESKSYTGIKEDVADSLLKKLQEHY